MAWAGMAAASVCFRGGDIAGLEDDDEGDDIMEAIAGTPLDTLRAYLIPDTARVRAAIHALLNAANQACALLAAIGFLAGATWEGATFNIIGVSITAGQALPLGYSCQAQPYSQQSVENRDAGQAMPIYIFVTTAGAVQSLAIGVYVQL